MSEISGRSLADKANRLVRRHLERIDVVAAKSPRILASSVLLLLLLSVFSVSKIRFETDIFRLFPSNSPALGLLLDSLEWTGSAKEAFFLLEGDPKLLPSAAENLALRLKAIKIGSEPAFSRIRYRIYEDSEAESFAKLIAFAATHPAAFIPLDQIPQFIQRIGPEGQKNAILNLSSILASQFGGAATSLAVADPLSTRDFFLPRLKKGSQALDLATDSPYFLSRDKKLLIMIAEPAKPVQDMQFARKLVEGINQARAGSSVRVSCAGAHISAVIDEAAMKSNIMVCIFSSLLVILTIFYITYRRLLPTLMIPVVLGAGVLMALGTAGLLLNGIHIISFAFMALIIGLGTDYSIHLYDRFHTERAAGKSIDHAISLAVTDTGHGLFTAAITTALPFLALTVSDIRALYELGLLVGLGVVFSLYFTLFFMPSVLRFTDRNEHAYRALPTLGMGLVWRFTSGYPRIVISLSLVIIVFLSLAALKSTFDAELKNLQPRHSEAFKAQELVEKHLNLAPLQILVAVDGSSLESVLSRSEKIEALAETLKVKGDVSAWSSIGGVLNRRDIQARASDLINRSLSNIRPDSLLIKNLENQYFDPLQFNKYIKFLASAEIASITAEYEIIKHLQDSPLKGVVDRHITKDRSGWHGLTYIYHTKRSLDQQQFVSSIKNLDADARVTSTDLVGQELLDSVKKSFKTAFFLGGAIVLVLIFFHFRDAKGIAASLIPVFIGTTSMLGAMALMGMKLNFMNSMVLVTIAGMGSDYGLHLHHRLSKAIGADDAEASFVQSSRAVLLSAITTVAGFGSLAFTDYGAMSSLGWATNFGIGFTAFAALVMLPAALHLKR